MDNAGLFVAVHRTELEQAQRQLTVGTATGCVDEVVHRAVHGLGVVVLWLLGAVANLVVLTVQLHGREHAVRVEVQVSGLLEQVALGDVRRVHKGVAVFQVAATGVLFHFQADDAAVRVEHWEARTDLVGEAEQIQLLAEATVVALFGFLHHGEVFLKRLLRLPGGAVNTLHAVTGLITLPVGSGGTHELESRDVARRGDVCRATAQVEPFGLIGARIDVAVSGEFTVRVDVGGLVKNGALGLVLNELQLVGLFGHGGACLIKGFPGKTLEALAGLDDLLHPLLDLLQILRGKGVIGAEVVVKTVFHSRADTELRTGELGLHSLCHNVRGGVPNHPAPLVRGGDDGRHRRVRLRDEGQILEVTLRGLDANDGVRSLGREIQFSHSLAGGDASGHQKFSHSGFHFHVGGVHRHTWPATTPALSVSPPLVCSGRPPQAFRRAPVAVAVSVVLSAPWLLDG